MRMASGAELIARERRRQTDAEAYSHRHDDAHTHDELVLAAVQYALPDERRELSIIERGDRWIDGKPRVPVDWPWEDDAWKPSPDDRIRELEKAGALIAAEIDRLIRADGGFHR